MSEFILEPVFDIGRDLQRAYDEGYKQGRHDEKVETETSLPNGEKKMNRQRKVVITVTYNEMGIIVGTKVEELGSSAQPGPCEDMVSRQRLLSDLKELVAAWKKYPVMAKQIKGVEAAIKYVEAIPPAMRGEKDEQE